MPRTPRKPRMPTRSLPRLRHRAGTLVPVLCAVLAAGCQRGATPGAGAAPGDAASAPAAAGVLVDPASGARCDGHDVRIARDGFDLVLDGACGDVVVVGSGGAVKVERARSIRIEGSRVTVLNRQVERVVVAGSDNGLNLTDVGEAQVTGDRNILLGRH